MTADSFRRALSSLAAAIALCAAFGAAAIELPDGFRETIEQGIANGRYQSVVVGLIEHEDRGDWQFGAIAPDGTKPISADLYEIGSTTRTFTGLLLAQALLAGKLRLDTPLKSVFGEVRFADPRLASATIGQIAAHRAGLPSIPSNLFPRSVEDPYVEYDAAALLAYLAHAHLNKEAGAYHYSDLGVALLGEAIARVYKKDYRTLLATEVLAPLALTQSGFGAVPRLLDGYRNGQPVAHWQYQTLSAAAGLRASLFDLMRFAAAQLRPDASPLRAGILLAREPRAVAGGGETALAWQIVPVASDGQNWPLLWQAGMTGGFASFIGLRTDRQRAIVLLGNAGVDLSALGLTLLADRQAPTPPPKLLPTVAPASLAYAGWYRFDTGGDLVVRTTADGLAAQISGLLPQPMSAYDDDAFELAGEASQLTFQRDQTKILGAILHFNGKHLRATRLSEGAPTLKRKTSASRADELVRYAGDYALSSSVRAHIVVATPGLRAQLTGAAPFFVQLCAADRFCDADGTLEIGFTQSGTAKATALDWRQGVFEAQAARDDW
jgi:D-alanyl-D-alanine-carboxypeptidase/D-alanyl-D-alanine-endopeptidase